MSIKIYKHYINGKLVEGGGPLMEVVNPATNEVVGQFHAATIEQTEEALQSAKKAFRTWSHLSLDERAAWMRKLRDECLKEDALLVELQAIEAGKTEYDIAGLQSQFYAFHDFYLEEAKRIYGTVIPHYSAKRGETAQIANFRPIGVVCAHMAWNAGAFNVGSKLWPIMASGCTGILKPSSFTPLFALGLGELCERIGLPAGVINIIAGPSSEIGNYMNSSTIPAMLSVIGSQETGMQVIRSSATSIKHFSLELGGNAPAIFMPDCDLNEAVPAMFGSKFANAGQGCAHPNRFFVHESIHDEFIKAAVEYVKTVPIGWRGLKTVACGALINVKTRDEKLRLVEQAVREGAKLVYGGGIPKDLPDELKNGAFMEPTILDGCTDDMTIASTETFAPIFTVFTFKDLDEVIERGNKTSYGLASYLWTHDARVILRCSEDVESGMLTVNGCGKAVNIPHVGMKNSGVGSVRGKWSMEEYYQLRVTNLKP